MGYSSLVRFCTTKEGFKKVKDYVSDKTLKTNIRNLLETADEQIEKNGFVIIGWDWTKWYEYSDEVDVVMKALDCLDEYNIPYKHIRVGESSEGDIDIIDHDFDNILPWMSVDTIVSYDESMKEPENHYVLFSCDEWKSCSSMSLIGVFSKYGLIDQLIKETEENNMEFGRSEPLYNLPIEEIDSSLKYGFIQEISIDEVL